MARSSSLYRGFQFRSHLQPASEAFLAWLRANGAPEVVVAVFREGTLREDVEDDLFLFGEASMMDENYIPVGIALKNGLLIFGSCPNGDHAAIDLRSPTGAVGYLCHENMQNVKDVRERSFWPVASSLDEAAERMAECKMPIDYFDARRGLEE